jgi:hypothetical protein
MRNVGQRVSEELLPRVRRPGQYIGCEVNARWPGSWRQEDPASVSVIEWHLPDVSPSTAAPPRERAARAPPRPSPAKAPGDPAARRHVRAGMSEGEVLAKLGAPDAASA